MESAPEYNARQDKNRFEDEQQSLSSYSWAGQMPECLDHEWNQVIISALYTVCDPSSI